MAQEGLYGWEGAGGPDGSNVLDLLAVDLLLEILAAFEAIMAELAAVITAMAPTDMGAIVFLVGPGRRAPRSSRSSRISETVMKRVYPSLVFVYYYVLEAVMLEVYV